MNFAGRLHSRAFLETLSRHVGRRQSSISRRVGSDNGELVCGNRLVTGQACQFVANFEGRILCRALGNDDFRGRGRGFAFTHLHCAEGFRERWREEERCLIVAGLHCNGALRCNSNRRHPLDLCDLLGEGIEIIAELGGRHVWRLVFGRTVGDHRCGPAVGITDVTGKRGGHRI